MIVLELLTNGDLRNYLIKQRPAYVYSVFRMPHACMVTQLQMISATKLKM